MEMVLIEWHHVPGASPSQAQWHPTTVCEVGSIVLTDKGSLTDKAHYLSYWERQEWFPVFFKELQHTPLFLETALGTEASHLRFCWVLKGENIIPFDPLPKWTFQRKKSQVQTHGVFSFLSPLLLSYTLYSLRSLDSLITVVVIITHLYFCRALLRSRESYKYELINCPSSPAGKRQILSSKAGALGLYVLGLPVLWCQVHGLPGALCGTVICLRHWRLKASWSLASRASNCVGVPKFPNQRPQPSTPLGHTHRTEVLPRSANSSPPWPKPKCRV